MRRIVALGGPAAQFAAADDGTHWYWTGVAWEPWTRPPLPQPDTESLQKLGRHTVEFGDDVARDLLKVQLERNAGKSSFVVGHPDALVAKKRSRR